MGKNCAVEGCPSFRHCISTKSFYKIFTAKRTNIDKWIEFCQNSPLAKDSVICERHFKDSDFCNPNNKSQGVHSLACPSLYPPTTGSVKPRPSLLHRDETQELKLEIKIEPTEVNF